MDQVTRDKLKAVRQQLTALKAVRQQLTAMEIVKNVAFGVSEAGYYYLPVIKVGQEHRASEIPAQMDGINIQIRYEKDQ